MKNDQHPIVFFDGHCGLCNRSVDWIFRHDKEHRLRFAPLQGTTATGLFDDLSQEELLRSFWLKDDAGLHRRSTAILRACRLLPPPASLFRLLLVFPKSIRDWVYDLIAQNRHKLWPRIETCRIPTPAERPYFLP